MSMDIESALYSRLVGFPGVAALIADRIYPDPAPQGTPYPFLVHSQQSEVEEQGLAGSHGLIHPRLTFKAWSKVNKAEARAVISSVRDALVGYPGVGGGRTVNGVNIQGIRSWGRMNGFDEESKTHWCSIDLEVWYTDSIPTF